ncbi:Glycosyltransferase, GT2 family [Nakamurella panacisegetis]|uniref:Glycosyltransferase, GT2 family n=1 Tax=Nakamurella panacisegetis TaxID=1090615 RepID=A0A1H0M092_9ACTN|nr:glycosyltransferase family 2 protein [Nakamurella panacisegetis]SDO73626.1 Glycosyltransferase, GT2 family [Nakamurella panacisegetis]
MIGSVTCSVVVCAYTLDRWDDLRASLLSVSDQSVQPDEVILVIDHNDLLLSRARTEFPGVRVMENRYRQGLSGGRNTAIAEARGDVVVFLDDDATADPGWLAALMKHYEDPAVIGVGGAAAPRWPAGRPAHLPADTEFDRGELDWVVGCTYAGQPETLTEVRNLMGCNMSMRRSVFASVGVFSEGLGRIGKVPLGCEETELCIRARQADPSARILFEPAALVHHRVTPDRVRWNYLISRCWAEGLSKAVVSRMVGQGDALSTERTYVGSVLPHAVGRELGRAVRRRRVRHLRSAGAIVIGLASTCAGYARGSMARSHGSRGSG